MIYKALKHFITITKHKYLVMVHCFKCHMYIQGLLHDLSKYSPSEFITGVRYYQGNRSPNAAEKEEKGYSPAWMHHKGRNKHHFEYWIDFSQKPDYKLVGHPMPKKYVVEMFLDRTAACKIYLKDKYTNSSPLEYFDRNKGHYVTVMHDNTYKLLEHLLKKLAKEGEEETFKYIRTKILKNSKG